MAAELKIIIFIITSSGFALLSRHTLGAGRSHGFYRFFVWEALLILVLINIDHWFRDPFKSGQVASWILLFISLVYVVSAAISIKKYGQPGSERVDPLLIGIEKTTRLVRAGAYKYIRHPMYGSAIFGAWGILLKNITWYGLGIAIITTTLAVITALREETENIRYFGEEYVQYKKNTRMFVPFVI